MGETPRLGLMREAGRNNRTEAIEFNQKIGWLEKLLSSTDEGK